MSDPATPPVTYGATLRLSRETVEVIAARLNQHRRDVGTRRGRRSLGCFAHAVLFCRWLLDGTGLAQLALDNAVSLKTTHRYLHEALDVLEAHAPSLRTALLAARAAGHTHLGLDGTLIHTDRVSIPGPTTRRTSPTSSTSPRQVDLWWSGKHHCHGANVQVLTAPDGWPIWTSPQRPGREHDTTCARTHPDLLAALEEWSDETHAVLADLGYEGERDRLTCPLKHVKGTDLSDDEQTTNLLHSATRALAERGNALLKTFKALRRVTLSPTRVGAITAAALVVLHLEHHRTT